MVQKSQKWPKTQIKGGGGPALTFFAADIPTREHDFFVITFLCLAGKRLISKSHQEFLDSFFVISEANTFRQSKVVKSKKGIFFFLIKDALVDCQLSQSCTPGSGLTKG